MSSELSCPNRVSRSRCALETLTKVSAQAAHCQEGREHRHRFGNDGVAAVKAITLFAIVLVLTVLQLRLSKHWVHYESET